MDLRTVGIVLLCATHLCLGALVVLHNRRALINKLFGFSFLARLARAHWEFLII